MSDWLSLRQWNELTPIGRDYDAVVELVVCNESDEDALCWCPETVPVDEIDRYQLIDDPDDDDGWAKVASFRAAIRDNQVFPPLALQHTPGSERGAFFLFDGRHRFNAAALEQVSKVPAWVMHTSCCAKEPRHS
jgi:hypothetical protein